MSKAPEFVVMGLHFPGVHYWARVLVSPDRLAHVKRSVLQTGSVHLDRGDRLEIETRCGDDQGLALTVCAMEPVDGARRGQGHCLVAWNGISDSINVYSDNQDELAAMHEPILNDLFYRDRVTVGQGFLDADKITSIVVGGVTVFFEPKDLRKVGPIDEVDEATSQGDYEKLSEARFATYAGASPLKVATAHHKLLVAMRALREAGLLPEAA